jgi:sugar transferase (PEP-CTERM/EpsH1 system associated)
MAQYVEPEHSHIPAVLDFVDVDSDKWTQYARHAGFPLSAVYAREGKQLQRYEAQLCNRFNSLIVTTEREAKVLGRISDNAPVHVIPNGVDLDYFRPTGDPADSDSSRPTVIFTGDMSYFPNEQAVAFFANMVLPVIRRSVREARFVIVGRAPTARVLRLLKIDNVEVTGTVPDIRPYLANAQVSVAPFGIAAGIQNKILEAMACGVPVVGTSIATRSLYPDVADMVDTADTAEELGARVVRLLKDPGAARRRGLAGRERVAAHYSWERSKRQLLEILEHSTRRNAASGSGVVYT